MRALSIRQPYAELILRGIKKIEYRSRRTRIIGERFYIYASRQLGDLKGFAKLGCKPGDLPVGVLVGTAKITKCNQASRLKSKIRRGGPHAVPLYEWHLTDVQRLKRPRKPKGHPQPVWFQPF